MSHRKFAAAGFTIVEVTIAMALALIVSITAYSLFSTLLNQYFGLQQDGTEFTNLASQSQRVANVIRGSTDIISESASDLSVYAYFSPDDTYVSQVHYYLNGSSDRLFADITPMTANPPIGVPIPAEKKTYVIIENYYPLAGLSLFAYLDAAGNTLTLPISDENTIKEVQINLAVPADHPSAGGNQRMSLQVSLRNRKTNL